MLALRREQNMHLYNLLRAGPRLCVRGGEMHHVSRNRASAGEDPVIPATIEFDLANLLERAGAHPPRHGRKWDCGRCQGRACLSVDLDRGLFHCFHGACGFSGSSAKLARELGLARRVSPNEYHRISQERARADLVARALYEGIKARRFAMLDEINSLNRLEWRAHEAGPDNPAIWDALALVYGRRPSLLAELANSESCGAADSVRFLTANTQTREVVVGKVQDRGGLYSGPGQFLDLTE